jgi:hypothetical protein
VSAEPDRGARRLYRGVLVGLGGSALVAAAGAAGESSAEAPAPPAPYLAAAVGLALVSILARGRAHRGAPSAGRTSALRLSLLCAGGLGLVGVLLGAAEGLWRAGLLYTVAGAILAVRPPPSPTETARRSGGPAS